MLFTKIEHLLRLNGPAAAGATKRERWPVSTRSPEFFPLRLSFWLRVPARFHCARGSVSPFLSSHPAVLVRLRAAPGLVRTIVATPSLEVRQLNEGTILAPQAYTGETGQAALLATARCVRDRFAECFAGASGTEVVSVEIGWRPMPADGEPVIGRPAGTRGLYVTVMHSAVTLAAAVGRLAATEILTGMPAPELDGCRPGRFECFQQR